MVKEASPPKAGGDFLAGGGANLEVMPLL